MLHMMISRLSAPKLLIFGWFFAPGILLGHEGFLPLHEHSEHRHAESVHRSHDTQVGQVLSAGDGKQHPVHLDHQTESRWAVASGFRYTRYASTEARGSLWTAGVGADFALLPWLHLGADGAYGWFDGDQGRAEGWLTPHLHLDVHVPLARNFEIIAGLEVGLPIADASLAGDHWEWAPHVELRYDLGKWYAVAGIDFAFTDGAHQHGEEDHEGEHDLEEHGEHGAELHEVVDPHGKRELRYHAAFGARFRDEALTAEARLTGIHVFSNDTDLQNYVRGSLRLTWRWSGRVSFSVEGNVPIGHGERNDWEASGAVRVRF